MPDTTLNFFEKILKEHDSHPEISCVLLQNQTFQQECENAKNSLTRFKNTLKAMPPIIDEHGVNNGKERKPTHGGWIIKFNKQFKKHTELSVDEIVQTKNLPLLKLLTQVRNEAAEILKSVTDLAQISESDYEQLKKDFDVRIAALLQAEMNNDN
jgi:hypothetical protein